MPINDSAEFAAAMADALPDATVGVDLSGRVLTFNNAAEALLGYRREDVIGRPLATLIPDVTLGADELPHKSADGVARRFDKASGLRGPFTRPLELLHQNGTRVRLRAKHEAIRDRSGTLLGSRTTLLPLPPARPLGTPDSNAEPVRDDWVVYLVGHDSPAMESLGEMTVHLGFGVREFASEKGFLSHYPAEEVGCVVAQLDAESDPEVGFQAHLFALDPCLPVIFLTERCEIRTTVAALRRGAVTILEEPLLETEYEEAVRLALAWRQSARQDHEASQRVRAAFDQLTDEELQVLRLVSAGLANKQVATRLKVSVRTVEDRRRRAMGKLDVGSFAELVRLTVAWESLDQR